MQTDPSELMDAIMVEARRSLQEMAGTSDLEQRRIHSETIKNLFGAMGVFFEAMNDAMSMEDMLDLDEQLGEMFEDEDEEGEEE